MMLIPLTDASRRPTSFPVVTAVQLVSLGAVAQHPATGGVAYAAHVGGFIFGAVVARLFARAQGG